MSLKIRTVSQLEELELSSRSDSANDVMEISIENGPGNYYSGKCKFSDIKKTICDYTDHVISSKYKMSDIDGQSPADIHEMAQDVHGILHENIEIEGRKTFNDEIRSEYYDTTMGSTVANVRMVKNLIATQGQYMSDNSYVKVNPINTRDGGETWNGSVYDTDNLYIFHIDHGMKDSSKAIDDNGREIGPLTTRESGELNIYGWLADIGSVLPQECWVALMMKVNVGSSEGRQEWIPVRISPWIMGEKSSAMQYVSFSVNVTKGQQFKIMTGFQVNGKTSGYMDGDSFVFKDYGTKGFTPNTFVGYVITNGSENENSFDTDQEII